MRKAMIGLVVVLVLGIVVVGKKIEILYYVGSPNEKKQEC